MKAPKNIVTYASLVMAAAGMWALGFYSRGSHHLVQAAQAAPELSTPDPVNIFASLAREVLPSVVNISTTEVVQSAVQNFFGAEGFQFPNRPEKMNALGSGFVIDPKGIILTNNHVVAHADQIKIQFTEDPNEQPTPGKVIGRDPDLDLALIQVQTDRKLKALTLGDSDRSQVGDYVLAAGNPYGQGHSVSHGIVSAKGRTAPGLPLANYLQVDAPINPGNSGGPLVNLRGEVIGINDAIDPRAQGIGFAIPINFVKSVLPQLEKKGTVNRGYIGAVVGRLTPDIAARIDLPQNLDAPFVTQVMPGSPAEAAGLQTYDAIIAVNGTRVRTPGELVRAITSAPLGEAIPVKIARGNQTKILSVRTKPKNDLET